MFADPVKNLRAFDLEPSDIVADLGAGTGFYAIAAAHMVPQGKVYAIEIIKDFIVKIKSKVNEARLKNVETLWGDVEKPGGTKIGTEIVDKVLASNILFQVQDKNKFIGEAHRILKPGGKLMLIDWSPDLSALVPKGAIPKAKARAMLEESGFTWQRDINAGEHHYGMIFKRK